MVERVERDDAVERPRSKRQRCEVANDERRVGGSPPRDRQLHRRQVDADVPSPRRQFRRVPAGTAAQLEHGRPSRKSREHLFEEPPANLWWALGVPDGELPAHPIVAISHDALRIHPVPPSPLPVTTSDIVTRPRFGSVCSASKGVISFPHSKKSDAGGPAGLGAVWVGGSKRASV